jgi:hypothetical protein
MFLYARDSGHSGQGLDEEILPTRCPLHLSDRQRRNWMTGWKNVD